MMNEEQMRLSYMRRAYSVQGWALLIYLGIMNVAVLLTVFYDAFYSAFAAAASGVEPDEEQLMNQIMDNSGWGYLLAIAIGLAALMLWKKPAFCFRTIWTKGKPMTVGSFFAILSIFISGQLVSQLMVMVMEAVMNLFGMSMEEYLASASVSTDGLSLFLYVSLGAPISEEILFRGLLLRSVEPFGKKFTIFTSALLFGLFHGNLIQAPFAFCVGLVLGYVAVEYSIGWAMVLHMVNNLLLSDTLYRLTSGLPEWVGNLLIWAVIIGFSIAAIVVLIVKRRAIADYFRREQDDPLCAKAFFSAPGIIVLLVVLAATIAYSLIIGDF